MRSNGDLSLDRWLRRLAWALASLPRADREEIVRETRSHIEERMTQGLPEHNVLAQLGMPEEYARGFLEEFELSQALGRRAFFQMVGVLGLRLGRSVTAGISLLLLSCLVVMTAGITLTAIMHFLDPVHWGVWLTPHMLVFGRADQEEAARELMGSWIYAFSVLCVFGTWMAGRMILLKALRSIASRSNSFSRTERSR